MAQVTAVVKVQSLAWNLHMSWAQLNTKTDLKQNAKIYWPIDIVSHSLNIDFFKPMVMEEEGQS